jgi:hypothetical protein
LVKIRYNKSNKQEYLNKLKYVKPTQKQKDIAQRAYDERDSEIVKTTRRGDRERVQRGQQRLKGASRGSDGILQDYRAEVKEPTKKTIIEPSALDKQAVLDKNKKPIIKKIDKIGIRYKKEGQIIKDLDSSGVKIKPSQVTSADVASAGTKPLPASHISTLKASSLSLGDHISVISPPSGVLDMRYSLPSNLYKPVKFVSDIKLIDKLSKCILVKFRII